MSEERADRIFLSLVGMQPAATAVLLKSWVEKNGPPAGIWLLATSFVERQGIAGRLRQFCAEVSPSASCQVVPIAGGLDDETSRPSALTWVRRFFEERGRSTPVVFAADPGPAFLTAALARELPSNAVFLHADSDLVVQLERWDGRELWKILPAADLGFDALLDLYGLRALPSQGLDPALEEALNQRSVVVPDVMRSAFELETSDGSRLRIELAYERKGRLYALCAATQGDVKQRVQQILASAQKLRNLNPILSVFCEDGWQRKRLRAAGVEPLGQSRLRAWVEQTMARTPGHIAEPYAAGGHASGRFRGKGGDGEPLLVWMGADPGATLTSIWTHRPRQLVLLYDANTPLVQQKVNLLKKRSEAIPAGRIVLVPSDHLGRNVSRRIRENYPQAKADLTPGTKAQTEVFARIPGLQLWSLRPPEAVALDGSASQPLQPPDLLTTAQLQGGQLRRGAGIDAKRWAKERIVFLLLLGRAVTQAPRELPLDPLPEFQTPRAGIRQVPGVVGLYDVWVDGTSARGNVPPKGGFWLEQVVAAALVKAGADEVRLNLKWDWPPGELASEGGPRDELDVAARFGLHIFAFSCKLKCESIPLRRQGAEVESVARTCLGRFAVPVTVRVRAPKNLTAGAPRQGAVFFDLAAVVAADFGDRLKAVAAARRTLGA
jgi:hypothetical protein